MLIIPAVDLLERRVVRVEQGDRERAKVYSNDPLSVIRNFVENGASLIHVVDLNAAIRNDNETNADLIKSILLNARGSVRIQLAGGIRNFDKAERLFNAGANRIVISSIAYSNLKEAIRILETMGSGSVVLALDYDRSGKVRTSGWARQEAESVGEALPRYENLGFTRFLLTAIERDGLLNGPDVATLEAIRKICKTAKIIASGGITSEEDVANLSGIGMDEAIIGKAIYEGRIPLSLLARSAL
ncbi:MAG: HisA/HisF-related TIM barrel protein [Nitrososphaerales archaeon]